jgi:hypothetical protein
MKKLQFSFVLLAQLAGAPDICHHPVMANQ